MLFNSFSFLAFFAVLAIVYYAVSHKYRWALLLAASLYFYAVFQPSYLILLLGVTLAAYLAGRLLGPAGDGPRRRAVLAAGVIAVLGALVVFKYYDFAARTLDKLLASAGAGSTLPLFPRLELTVAVGLSFFTFSCLSYLADVYAGRRAPERHFGRFALYASFFPKLLAGPIERAGPFLSQLVRPVAFSAAGVTAGLQWMLWGLFKKVVIADRLAAFVDAAYAQPAFSSPADLVLGTYFFAFQLYCDFSGYSDMAIGASKVLGIDLIENFRRPYLSASVPEFWSKRWHLSLAGWFRDYLYIPMGGSRRSRLRRYLNVMAVFLVRRAVARRELDVCRLGRPQWPLPGILAADAPSPRTDRRYDRPGEPAISGTWIPWCFGHFSSDPRHLGLFPGGVADGCCHHSFPSRCIGSRAAAVVAGADREWRDSLFTGVDRSVVALGSDRRTTAGLGPPGEFSSVCAMGGVLRLAYLSHRAGDMEPAGVYLHAILRPRV